MIGVDIVEVPRFRALLARRPRVVERLFTPAERDYAAARADPTERLAARFAAKEAVMKALGAGFGDVNFREMEVVRAPGGQPGVRLAGRAAARARSAGVAGWHLSLSHTSGTAIAVALAVPSTPADAAVGVARTAASDPPSGGAALPEKPGRARGATDSSVGERDRDASLLAGPGVTGRDGVTSEGHDLRGAAVPAASASGDPAGSGDGGGGAGS